MREQLYLTKQQYQEMVSHAQEAFPIEACGYLAGNDGEVTQVIPMKNVDESPEHFSFDPKEQFQVLKAVRASGQRLIGVYHSHPETPARLSEEDIRLFNDGSMVYVIVSLKEKKPSVGAYRVLKPSPLEIEIKKVAIEVKKEA